jgi:hypothetical protein
LIGTKTNALFARLLSSDAKSNYKSLCGVIKPGIPTQYAIELFHWLSRKANFLQRIAKTSGGYPHTTEQEQAHVIHPRLPNNRSAAYKWQNPSLSRLPQAGSIPGHIQNPRRRVPVTQSHCAPATRICDDQRLVKVRLHSRLE